MSPWPPITLDDLRQAADATGFDTMLPILVRRLIRETAGGFGTVNMPGESGTAAGGFDGVVTAGAGSEFVPAGTSVWELSVERNVGSKADSDYAKRSTGPNGEDPQDITYVQVILRSWVKAGRWAQDRTEEGRWKKVEAYNLDRIREWLESAPATAAWFAEVREKALPGVQLLDQWWDESWLASTLFPLTQEWVLAGREDIGPKIVSLLDGGGGLITLGGGLPAAEYHAVIAASLQSESGAVSQLAARTLLVDDTSSLVRLRARPEPLVLVVRDLSLLRDSVVRRPHVVVSGDPLSRDPDVVVPRVDGEAIAQLLTLRGTPFNQARESGALARRSFLGFVRGLAKQPSLFTPEWAIQATMLVRRLLLVGSWSGANSEDQRAVAACVGRPYEEVTEQVRLLPAVRGDAFMECANEHWHLTFPEEGWSLLASQLLREDMDAWRKVFDHVTTADRLPQRTAGLQGRISSQLWEGLTTTAARLGAQGAVIRFAGGRTAQTEARMAVAALFARANADLTYRMWEAIADGLLLLAEAAPDEFLDALREGITGADPLHTSMFHPAGSTAIPPIFSTVCDDVLAALGMLTWLPDYFDEAVAVLAGLAALDPATPQQGRPYKRLQQVFSVIYPRTGVSEEQRNRVLDRLLRTQPDIARPLLISLVSSHREFVAEIRNPQFREHVAAESVTPTVVTTRRQAITDLLLADLDDVPERYLAIASVLDDFPAARWTDVLDRLIAAGGCIEDDGVRAQISDTARSLAARHRQYSAALWARTDTQIARLEALAEALAPKDPAMLVAWLFAQFHLELGNPAHLENYSAHEADLIQRRAEAVNRLHQDDSLALVERLVDLVRLPYLVGEALAVDMSNLDDSIRAWLSHSPARRQGALGYIQQRISQRGPAYADEMIQQLESPDEQAAVLLLLPTADAWPRLTALPGETGTHYWRAFRIEGHGPGFPGVAEAVTQLAGVRRYAVALELVALYSHSVDSVEIALAAADALTELVRNPPTDLEPARLGSYDLQQVLKVLNRHIDALGRTRVAELEWLVMPALGFEADSTALHTALSEDPAFFAEIVSYVNPGGDEPADTDSELTEQQRQAALSAYELLDTWTQCPGLTPDAAIDQDRLRAWIAEARTRAAATGHRRSGDHAIGKILARSPEGRDGQFPQNPIPDLLEELGSEDIDRGFGNAVHNKHSASVRRLTEGGRPEEQLATHYRSLADSLVGWPRIRRILRRIADSLDAEARRRDDEAERWRQGLMS
ncbi:hypothetical protein [Nocardia aurantiaca]|uniref:Uncharacterized protein n=1 Tax=Nocardia aurantiaca TaxID=2675850 RepID=A0A6I3L6E0_9NOCA|nr:hypothetical protein [Nocardia aurantiaca]MTE17457.1 hypothetical protein [Nocardia aurantiaca]